MTEPHQYVQTVALKDVKCFAYHGFYEEEQLTGTYFSIDLTVSFVPDADTENLEKTVNYEVLNEIILEEIPTNIRAFTKITSGIGVTPKCV